MHNSATHAQNCTVKQDWHSPISGCLVVPIAEQALGISERHVYVLLHDDDDEVTPSLERNAAGLCVVTQFVH